MSHVTSKDGTRIAYERLGSGPPVMLSSTAPCIATRSGQAVLPGQTHNVAAVVLVPALVTYFNDELDIRPVTAYGAFGQ